MAAYHGVVFQKKEGTLFVSSDGIIFQEKHHSSEEEDTDIYTAYEGPPSTCSKKELLFQRHIPWRFVRRHRINDRTEPQAAMRLWIRADYGDMGMDDETLVFGLANREQLKRFSDDIEDCFRSHNKEAAQHNENEKKGSSVVSSMSMTTEQSYAERTETTEASSATTTTGSSNFNATRMAKVEPNKDNSNVTGNADSLVFKVREHLLRAALQGQIEGASQGSTNNSSHPDEILRSIYEQQHGNNSPVISGGSAAAGDYDAYTGMLLARMIAEQLNCIQEENKSRNSSGDKSSGKSQSSTQQVPSSIPRHLKLDMTTNNHGPKEEEEEEEEDDGDGSLSRLSATSFNTKDIEDYGQVSHRYPSQSGLASLPAVTEPDVLAASASTIRTQSHLGSQSHHHGSYQSSDEERTQMVGLVRQLDERDRQAKRRARSGSDHVVGRGRSSSMSSGGISAISAETPQDQHQQQELLKNRLLTQLGDDDMTPGAHRVVGGSPDGPPSSASSSTGTRRRQRTQGPGGTDNKNTNPISDGQLVEAYLVAQQSIRNALDDTTIEGKSALEDTRRLMMSAVGELTETEFLDALQAVIDNRKRAPPAVLVGIEGEKDIVIDSEPELEATVTAAVVHPEVPRAAPEAPLDNFAGANGTAAAHPAAANEPIRAQTTRKVEAPIANTMARHEAMLDCQSLNSPAHGRAKKEEESSCGCCPSADAAGVPLSDER